jgi:rod shape determining protein RodA
MYIDAKDEQRLAQKIKLLPRTLMLVACILLAVGIAVLYSAAGGKMAPWALRHIYTMVIISPVLVILVLIDLSLIYKFSYHFYIFCIILLIVAEVAGHKAMGAQRWLRIGAFTLQPSEICKIGLILALSRYFHNLHSSQLNKITSLVIPSILILLPSALVLKQPNLGTAIILLWTGICIFFLAGISLRYFMVSGLLTLAAAPFAWALLHDYQKRRIMTFLNPESDPLGAGYNIMQSKIAIGSGGIVGKGFISGSQSQLSFLPEKQTDFIFTVLAEEWGFVGVTLCLLLYSLLLASLYNIALTSQNHFGRLVAAGSAGMIFIHIFINIAMISGLLPVVGIPLPLLSYGGSNLLAMLLMFAIVANIAAHRQLLR